MSKTRPITMATDHPRNDGSWQHRQRRRTRIHGICRKQKVRHLSSREEGESRVERMPYHLNCSLQSPRGKPEQPMIKIWANIGAIHRNQLMVLSRIMLKPAEQFPQLYINTRVSDAIQRMPRLGHHRKSRWRTDCLSILPASQSLALTTRVGTLQDR